MKATLRVKPGASRTAVGGRHGSGDVLVVAVPAPAVDGKANKAVLAALAKALGTRPNKINIVSGQLARTKVVELPDEYADAFRQLLSS